MRVKVNIHLKKGILDPQGKAVHHALDTLGFNGVKDVRIGKQVLLDLDVQSKEDAIKEATLMADKLLANSVTEDFSIEVIDE